MRRLLALTMVCLWIGAAPPARAAATPLGPDFNGDGHADLVTTSAAVQGGAVTVLYGPLDPTVPVDGHMFSQATEGIPGAGEPEETFGVALATGDLNGDGYDDLAVGVDESFGGTYGGQGDVTVVYGSADGLDPLTGQLLRQGVNGVPGLPHWYEQFGAAVAVDDLDADGFAELIVGIPGDRVDRMRWAGSVQIFAGGPDGVIPSSGTLWNQNTEGVVEHAEKEDRFGSALAVGDLDGDTYPDLAIGVPWEERRHSGGGGVSVLYGSADGPTPDGDLFANDLSLGTRVRDPGLHPGSNWLGLGLRLASGDLDGDGDDDLAIGDPCAPIGTTWYGSCAGMVVTAYAAGRSLGHGQKWRQGHNGLPGVADGGDTASGNMTDNFGESITIEDLGGGPEADLAIGVPGDVVDDHSGAGSVHVLFGSPDGATAIGNQFWTQNTPGVLDEAEGPPYLDSFSLFDNFGQALTCIDADGDTQPDLVIGVPDETIAGEARGAVAILLTDATGPTAAGDSLWAPAVNGVPGSPGQRALFGRVLP